MLIWGRGVENEFFSPEEKVDLLEHVTILSPSEFTVAKPTPLSPVKTEEAEKEAGLPEPDIISLPRQGIWVSKPTLFLLPLPQALPTCKDEIHLSEGRVHSNIVSLCNRIS